MLLQRQGLPEDGELVLCTVTSVQYHSVFAKLDEFHNKSGMIHISEVAPGRIRNIREFVSEGKKVVCKVLAVDHERDRIDLSLRRVNDRERRQKNDLIRREQQAEKILEYFAQVQKRPFKDMYKEIAGVFLDPSKEEHFVYLSDVFDDVVNKDYDLTEAGLDPKIAKPLMDLIHTRIKPPEVSIEGKMKLKSYAANGVKEVQDALKKAKDADVAYLGGGAYSIKVTDQEYRGAEKKLKAATEAVQKFCKKHKTEYEFIRV